MVINLYKPVLSYKHMSSSLHGSCDQYRFHNIKANLRDKSKFLINNHQIPNFNIDYELMSNIVIKYNIVFASSLIHPQFEISPICGNVRYSHEFYIMLSLFNCS